MPAGTFSRQHGLQQVELDSFSRTNAFIHGAVEMPFHWHKEMEILISLRGSARIVVEGRVCVMQEGDVMIINAYEAHNSMSLSADTILCGVHVDLAHYERSGLRDLSGRYYYCRSFLHGRSFDKVATPLKAFVGRLILTDDAQTGELAVRSAIALALACSIYQNVPWQSAEHARAETGMKGRERILRVIDSMTRSEAPPELQELAVAERVTVAHLSRLFRAHTGVSFREYAQNVRLDLVAEDLLTTEKTVTEIIAIRGVGNPALFFHRFRARFDCSPSMFRAKANFKLPEMPLKSSDDSAKAKLLELVRDLSGALDATLGLSLEPKRRMTISAFHSPPFKK